MVGVMTPWKWANTANQDPLIPVQSQMLSIISTPLIEYISFLTFVLQTGIHLNRQEIYWNFSLVYRKYFKILIFNTTKYEVSDQ